MKIVSQNLWFDEHQRAVRMLGHLEQWKRARPDLIAVQEATLACLRALLADAWLNENYWCSVQLDSPAAHQGLVVFSARPPLCVHRWELPSRMGRRVLAVDLGDLLVAVVHLESSSSNAEMRAQQIQRTVTYLSGYEHALWLGDFNLCGTSAENHNLPADFLDLWPHLRPNENGWTLDTSTNSMLLRQSRKPQQVRYDRALLRSSIWRAQSMELLGTEALQEGLFASDHFGLLLELTQSV